MLSLFLGASAFTAPSSLIALTSRRAGPCVMDTGTAMRWNVQKGFGFISPDDGGEDLFCHFSAIEDGGMLEEGAKVTFVKGFDERKGKDRAESVTGGSPRPDGFESGGGRPPRAPRAPAEILGGVTGEPPAGMQQGTVKFWNNKGFGFIETDSGDLFCHFSAISDGNALSAGATVHFAKDFDEQRGNDRACEVLGGYQEEFNGGGGGRGGPERRFDSDGSGPFTKREFVDEYGGYAEWDAATPA